MFKMQHKKQKMLFIFTSFYVMLQIMGKRSNKNDWLTRRLREIKKPKNALAHFIGIPQQHINNLITGKSITPQRIEKISEFMDIDKASLFEFYAGNIDEEQLLSGRNEKTFPVKSIPVVGFVAADVWQNPDNWDKNDFYRVYIPYDERLVNKRVFALEVKGNAMDLVYPDGACVLCVTLDDYTSVFGSPESGKKVVVRRVRTSDGLIEVTIKEFVQNDTGTFLVPRSSDPSVGPVKYTEQSDNQSEIIAVVVASYRWE